jgi:hypothetical protein
MVCIKFSFSFIKTTARAGTTSLKNQWLAMAAVAEGLIRVGCSLVPGVSVSACFAQT